jgi:hypothetical protein
VQTETSPQSATKRSFLRRYLLWHIGAAGLWIVMIALVPVWLKETDSVARLFGCLAPVMWLMAYGVSCLIVAVANRVKEHWVWGMWLPVHLISAVYFYYRMARPLLD